MRRSVLTGALLPCVIAASCGSSTTDLGSLNGKSPEQILSLMRTAIAASHSSFSFVDESTVGSQTTKLTGDDSHAGADQTVSGSVATLEVVRTTRGNIYLRGAANVLHATLGIPPSTAAANSDHWIVLTQIG